MSGHAKRSPSAAETWMTCPGAEALCATLPDRASSFAQEGTCAHELQRTVLDERYSVFGDGPTANCYQHVGRRFNVAEDGQEPVFVTVDTEMANYVQMVVDYVEKRRQEMTQPVHVYTERRVSCKWALGTDIHDGTADITLVSPDEMEVIDLKYGKGVVVECGTLEAPNKQMMFYLVGACEHDRLGASRNGRCRITIAQPRAEHNDGWLRSLGGLGVTHMSDFIAAVKTADAAIQPGAPRVPSDKGCRFCRGKPLCREYIDWAHASIDAPRSFDEAAFLESVKGFALQNPEHMPAANVVRILQNADLMRGMLSALEEWAHDALRSRNAPPELAAAFKLIRGHGRRRWAFDSEESVAAELAKIRWKDEVSGKTAGLGKKMIFEDRLRSPKQIEALLQAAARSNSSFTATHWDAFNRLVTKPEGALQLVPISDERPDAMAVFTDIGLIEPPTIDPLG